MALDILALTDEIVRQPIETIKFVGSPMDRIRSVAIVNKKGNGNFLLKTIKPNPVQCSTIYVFGNGKFYTFKAKAQKQGYEVSVPEGYDEFPPAEDLLGLNVSRERTYYAYRKDDLPEHCMIRLQELEIESMKAMIEESTPEQLKSLFDMSNEQDKSEQDDGMVPVENDREDAIQSAIEDIDPDELDPEAVVRGLEMIRNNFELAKFTLSRTKTNRETVEAYFNMSPGLMEGMPVSVVSIIDAALNAALERAEEEEVQRLLMDTDSEESDEDDLGK